MPSNQARGIQLALVTAFVSGVAIFVNKFAVDAIKPPLVFTATKNAGVGLLILGILLATRKWRLVKKLTRRELAYLVAIGIIGGSVPFYLYFTGLSQISAINAALIHKTLVFWVAAMAVPLLKEKFSLVKILAVLALFGGNLILGGFQQLQFSGGELLVLTATILWAVENILAKKILPTVEPDIVCAARMGFGSLILLASAAAFYPKALGNVVLLNPTQWMWMFVTMATLLAYIMSWYRALKLAPAITVTAVLVVSTLVTNVLSAVFITHIWNFLLIIQAGLMLGGIGLFWASVIREKPVRSKLAEFRIISS